MTSTRDCTSQIGDAVTAARELVQEARFEPDETAREERLEQAEASLRRLASLVEALGEK